MATETDLFPPAGGDEGISWDAALAEAEPDAALAEAEPEPELEPEFEPDFDPRSVTAAPLAPAAPTPVGMPRSGDRAARGWRSAAVVGLLIAGLLIAGVVLLWQHVDDLNRETVRTRTRVTDVSGLNASVAALERSVADLQGSVKALNDASAASAAASTAATGDVVARLAALQTRADTLAACINTYMDVMSRWTRNYTVPVVYTPCA
jgi:hypothetical protein